MRALHLLKTSVGATWALHQIRELVREGLQVHVALPPGPLVPHYEAAGASLHLHQFDVALGRPGVMRERARALRALVTSLKPDIVHSHFVGTTLMMRLALGRSHSLPRVFQVPGPLHLEYAIYRNLELLSAGPSDHWIGSCRWTCERYARSGVPPGRCFLAYYGTDITPFSVRAPGGLRAELQLAASTSIAGMVAYMYAPKRLLGQTRGLKGHEDLLDAVALCQKRGADIACVMVGAAWNRASSYERHVRAYGAARLGPRAIFLGMRSDVPALYQSFDVAVHPSHSENVGGAAESLLAGVPTIATQVGGFPDLITAGETGWLVPARDPAALADAILAALADRPHALAMAARGQQRARELLDVRNSARRVVEIYRTILRERQADTAPSALAGRAVVST